MATATALERGPRYGSAAELARYGGLSVKTVRRLVESGKVRGFKVGRRLLIPFADLDRHIRGARRPGPDLEIGRDRDMATAQASPHRSVDAHGRALPLTEEQARARAEEAIRALDDVAEMGDEEEQRATFEALRKAIDEEPMSYRKRFRG